MKSPKLLVSLLLVICIPDLCHSQQEQFAEPFRIMVRQVDECDESGTRQIYITSTRISRVGRNKYVYSTNVTIEVNVNDDVTAEIDIAAFGNGGWRPHYMQIELPQLCSSMKRMTPAYYDAIKSVFHECPIAPGTYVLKDVEMGNLKVGASLPNFPYGRYRTDFAARINGTLIGCIRLYSEVVPIKRARPQKKPKNNS